MERSPARRWHLASTCFTRLPSLGSLTSVALPPGCAMRIEKGLKKLPGVLEATVNLATEQATVAYDPAQTNVTTMVHKVDAIG